LFVDPVTRATRSISPSLALIFYKRASDAMNTAK
jgi:hypothetical protein